MCGICGFNWNDKNLVGKMIHTLKHRGPDDSGNYLDNEVSLGHTRLAIIDLSAKGKQPIHNEDNSIWIIFNGEIYNYQEIKKRLLKMNHNFYTNTDTEVIIHAYEQFGTECLNQFNGQFAFCIYDSNKKSLFLARDRFGIKPLYYFFKNNSFIFASEIKSILQYDFKKSINKKALREYLTFRFTIAPNSIFNNVYKLYPSSYLIYDLDKNSLKINKYYTQEIQSSYKYDINTLTSTIYKLINDSVRLRMIADVPVCSFLSGGIDSSIITYMATKYNPNINTYSVGFENFSELKFAKIVSDYFKTNHHELIIKKEDVLGNIEKMIYHMDEPIGDAAFFPTLLISELVSRDYKVVLAGEGSDEIFGGYDKYKLLNYGKKISWFLPKVRFQNDILQRIGKFSKLDDYQGYIEVIRAFTDEELKLLKLSFIQMKQFQKRGLNRFQKMQFIDLNTSLCEDFFMKADKMSSAFGLEERVPFMDHRLVSFALNLPTKLKLRFWNEKFILKQTFSNILPKVIIKRRKTGYNTPMDLWLKTVIKDRFLEIFHQNRHNLYKKDYIIDLYNRLLKTGSNYKQNFYLAQKLWSIYVFEEWFNQYMN
ncbi:MAG: asparagine synthase (glutamine-hydrolyzing) [Promethearchaeota archaeon]|nr:MAG: asparagine synthase (glutamine-hydrolyzing) [Candidatus Lokiarchaeota archaeon]